MPEYLAPGVYVEEVSFRSKSIEGVSTTTTGLIGPTRYGPLTLEPDIITSLGEFERIYGDRQQLDFSDTQNFHNYLWHGVRAFFEEGGKRLYVSRVFHSLNKDFGYPPDPFETAETADRTGGNYHDGHARARWPASGAENAGVQIRARFPGAAGNVRVRITLRLGQSVLGGTADAQTVGALLNHDIVWISDQTSPIASLPGSGTLYRAESYYDTTARAQTWRFVPSSGSSLELTALTPAGVPAEGDQVRVITATITVVPNEPGALTQVWDGLALDPRHERSGARDSLTARFAERPANLAQQRTLPIVIEASSQINDGLELLEALLTNNDGVRHALGNPEATDEMLSFDIELTGGNDGMRPLADDYLGVAAPDQRFKTGLRAFEDLEDISIVAAPGSTFGLESGYRSDANTIINHLITHATRMRYRIAVLDSGNDQSISQVRAMRAKIDSTYAALYYPWVRVLDPVTREEINLPPSGFVAGIYARNDVNRAVWKAPANEVVNLAIGFETLLNKGQQDVLNPEGVNCFRFFEGRGFRLWGARTVSSDPEWKYVNLRRYFAYLERSIDKGTQWAVFEPNGPALWDNVRTTVSDFLFNEWVSGALLGDKPEKAFFVKCDRSTMTQNDLDNGRLICLIGIAPLRPAEFVVFRIGQWTADRRG